MVTTEIIEQYFLPQDEIGVKAIDNGLINATYFVENTNNGKKFILQKINTQIFKNPQAIVNNHLLANNTLSKNKYSLELIELLPNSSGQLITQDRYGNSWRLMSYIDNSQTVLKVENAAMAEKAVEAFGEFYLCLNQENIHLHEVLPGFIDFDKRMQDFKIAITQAQDLYKKKAKKILDFLLQWENLPQQWITWQKNNALPKRIIHADPKISNVLFNPENQAIAIIDWDTLMQATLLYDFGDMVRSYTNRLDEDSIESTENFNPEYYEAVKRGFLKPLTCIITDIERENLDYAAQVVIYIQAVRFITDYLNGSQYYSIRYETHNLDRANNQINLLKGLQKYLEI